MNILETHRHTLRFGLDSDAPTIYIERWKEIKMKCENGNNKYVVEQIKNNCKILSNKNLPYLERCEGGLGGNDNLLNKQIRFRMKTRIKYDNDILLHISNTKTQKWSYDELDDIVRSFTIVLNNKMRSPCINGCIEMINEKAFGDKYLDSDTDFE